MRATVFALLVCIGACGGEGGDGNLPQEEEQVAVLGKDDVVEASLTDVAAGVVVTGTLEPSEIVDIKAQVAGTIRDLRADRGVPVSRGQRLATIDAQGVRAQVAGAEAGVAAAQTAIAAAEANLATAQRQLEGAKKLYEAGAMSEIDFRNAQAQYEAAVGQLAAAKAQAAAARSELTGARETAGRTTVTTPISGVVSARPVSEGEAVTVGQVLFTVVNSQTLELAGQVPVQQAAQIRVGQEVSFTLDAYPGQVFTGAVARIDPVADPATRQVGVWLELPNPGGKLVGGQFVTGRVVTANVRKAITIPRLALRTDEKGQYVLIVEGDRIARRDVTTGPDTGSPATVVIESGLRAGDRVIVTPGTTLTPGTRIREGTQ